MSTVIPLGDVDWREIWPGTESIDLAGAALAVEMLERFDTEPLPDNSTMLLRDLAAIERWPRQGRPYRNLVLEFLHRARAAGPEAEAGFCSLLGDWFTLNNVETSSTLTAGERYEELLGIPAKPP